MITNKPQRKILVNPKKTLGTSVEKKKKKMAKPVIDLKMTTPDKKMTVLKEYLKSIGNNNGIAK